MDRRSGETLSEQLTAALAADAEATLAWQVMPPSHRRDHVKFVSEAKRAETRSKRSAKVVAMTRAWHEHRATASASTRPRRDRDPGAAETS